LVSGVGGFAALFRCGFPEMKSPCLVSSTDGVGTKVKIAAQFQDWSGIGQDLVAMCVNDLICCGATPLFFLDYYATSKLDLDSAKAFLTSVKNACYESECMLIGGETAEMPGVYASGEIDCAGFSVGVVDEPKVLGSHMVKVGDVAIGISSSGFHSNGYSLLRKVFAEDAKKWKSTLLKPTALYPKVAKSIFPHVHAISHITGGGMDNVPRVMPKGTHIELKKWALPAEFLEVQKRAGLSHQQMLETFNCGMGLLVICTESEKLKVLEKVSQQGFRAWEVGVIEAQKDSHAEPTWAMRT
jgi:phosphoribosylformylglycinamidine cyclo-ligase